MIFKVLLEMWPIVESSDICKVTNFASGKMKALIFFFKSIVYEIRLLVVNKKFGQSAGVGEGTVRCEIV